jgi:hypothetical protein
MRFRVEQIYLTDEEGKIISRPGVHPMHHLLEAANVDSLLSEFVASDGAQIVGEVLKFPGFQAIATVKRDHVVYTLQVLPATDRLRA